MCVITGSKSVAGAKQDFDWLCKNILHYFRDTQIDVRSSAKYRQVSSEPDKISCRVDCGGSWWRT